MNVILAAAEEAAHSEPVIPAAGIGLLAFAGLMALLFVTLAFRSVGTRHQNR